METAAVLLVALLVFVFGLGSRRLAASSLTPPMVFTLAGLGCGIAGFAFLEPESAGPFLTLLAEATLIFVLFTDAARIDLRRLRRDASLPLRLLGFGLPLQILLGAAAAKLLFPELSWWQAGLLSAVLAPTDAALGQAVVSSPKVPQRVRQTLNVESGLNDGIALPVVTLFVATCLTMEREGSAVEWVELVGRQILFGLIAGLLVGWLGAQLIERAHARDLMETSFRHIAALAGAVSAYALAHVAEGNGFIAAFVAGATFGAIVPHHGEELLSFAEEEGQLLALLTFFFYGAVLLPVALRAASWQALLYAAASLTLLRMVPVALALLGTGLRSPTVLFLGWFGPRGLASILFALLIVEASDIGNARTIVDVAFLTVLASVLLHGLSARPLSARLEDALVSPSDSDEPLAEMATMPDMPTRLGRAR